jgi:hypothetical protein
VRAQDALRALEMPRFTRRYPAILETLMKQMLNMVHVSDTAGGGGACSLQGTKVVLAMCPVPSAALCCILGHYAS